ncbi:hypothetical protein ACEQ8H_004370 [Pleosporales sp. CAS-2024a]
MSDQENTWDSQLQATPPPQGQLQQQSRLGILPSPAKSACSAHDQDSEQNIPPVPQIPDGVCMSHDLSANVIQSITRYATPPVPTANQKQVVAKSILLQDDNVKEISREQFTDEEGKKIATRASSDHVYASESATTPTDQKSPSPQSDWSLQSPTQSEQRVFRGSNSLLDSRPIHDPSRFGPMASVQPVHVTHQNMRCDNYEDLDDDDQPPWLSYDPVPVRPEQDESESRPSYLTPSHLDVSDEEDMQDGSIAKSITIVPFLARDASEKNSGVLPKGSRLGQTRLHKQVHNTTVQDTDAGNHFDTGAGAQESASAHFTAPQPLSGVANDSLTNKIQNTARAQAGSRNPEPAAAAEAVPVVEKTMLVDATPIAYRDDSQRRSRDEASTSSTPIWFSSQLRPPNSRVPAMTDSRAAKKQRLREGIAVEGSRSRSGVAPPNTASRSDEPHAPTRVSRAPVHVAHGAYNSSFALWDRNSASAKPMPSRSQSGDMRDDSDMVTPAARVPKIIQHGQADRAEQSNDDNTGNAASSHGYFGDHEIPSATIRLPHQHSSELTVPERSKSILSIISSMVSEDGTPISPASSNAGRSTPSTIRRMHYESSARNPSTTGRIPEESFAANGDHTPTGIDDGYDLYADHNGIVKDLRDERGQPVRVQQQERDLQVHENAQPAGPAMPATGNSKRAGGDDVSRYSTERPMSFISGPTDQDGRPQDQVNQPLRHSKAATQPGAEQPYGQRYHENMSSSNGTTQQAKTPVPKPKLQQSYMVNNQQRSLHDSSQAQAGATSAEQFRVGGKPPLEGARANKPITSKRREQPVPASASSHRPLMNGQKLQAASPADRGIQDQRMYGNSSDQFMSQQAMQQGQTAMPGHDPRSQIRQEGQSSSPRNDYERQQQMMQVQGQYLQPNDPGLASQANPYLTAPQAPKQHDKPSSLPKLSAVFKGLGGRIQGNGHQATNANYTVPRPDQPQTQLDPNRSASYQSGVSGLQFEQLHKPGEQPLPSVSSNRPISNGTDSQFSHASHGSTYAQPTHSRVDSRNPASSMPFQGIPPQILPHEHPKPTGQPQVYAANTAGGGPEMGKKKRFSSLGNIFSRSNEPKLSKEQRKARKTQRMSTPLQMQGYPSQWPPQHPKNGPQMNGMPYPPGQYPPRPYPPQQVRGPGPQLVASQAMPPTNLQGAQSVDPYGSSQHYQKAQPGLLPPQPPQGIPADEASAYLRTRQLAEQHQAQQALAALGQSSGSNPPPVIRDTSMLLDQHAQQAQQPGYGPPLVGYYNPNPHATSAMSDKGAYVPSQAAREVLEQQSQQSVTGPEGHVPPFTSHQEGRHGLSSMQQEHAYRALHAERLRLEQIRLQLEAEGHGHNDPRLHQLRQQEEQLAARGDAFVDAMNVRQQSQQGHMPLSTAAQQLPGGPQHLIDAARDVSASTDGLLGQEQEQFEQQRLQQQQQHHERIPPSFAQRATSGPLINQTAHSQAPIVQRHVSPPIEPQYETPQIPAAYRHVSGAFISPLDQEQSPQLPAPSQFAAAPDQHGGHYFDTRMPASSPQISAQSQMPPNNVTYSGASTASVISPIGAPAQNVSSSPSPPDAWGQRSRMGSISEVQQSPLERPWHLNFPEGATEQEIVRARQKQFMQQQFIAREQQHAERVKQSPSPRGSPHCPSYAQVSGLSAQQQGGGFKELLPRSSPQPHSSPQPVQSTQATEQARSTGSPQPPGLTSQRSEQPHQSAAYPLPMKPESANVRSPDNALDSALPAPSLPLTMESVIPDRQLAASPERQRGEASREQYEPSPRQDAHYSSPSLQESSYEQVLPDEPPPSYDGLGVPNDGMDKIHPERSRPPNISTNVDVDHRGRQDESRARQPSIGILQHPQPASMAASPQRSSADMGAESLRRQLLQQEEYARMERIQRAQMQHAISEREKQEREAARARARELERSVSGGATVGSIRSVGSGRSGRQSGWERRGSTSRPVFELAAVEDDEPAMRATSYPGQEWVPENWTDD